METRANYATIGIFTVIVIALSFGFVYWLKRFDEAGQRTELQVAFDGTVSGLAKGGIVYFNGIKVGEVSALEFDNDNPNRVRVFASIARTTPVKPDTRAEVNFNFLTGVAYVELFGGTRGAENILGGSEVAVLTGVPSSLTDVISGASRMFKSAEISIGRVNDMMAEVTPSIAKSIENVESFTDVLASNADGIQQFLGNVSQMSETVGALSTKLEGLVDSADQTISAVDADKIRSMVASGESFMKRIDEISGDIGPIMTDVRKVASNMSEFSTGLNATLTDANEVIAALDPKKIATTLDGISEFAGKLDGASDDFDEIIADAKAAADNVNKFTASIQSHTDDVDAIVAEARQLTERVNAASTRLDGILGKTEEFLGTEGGENFFAQAAGAASAIRKIAETFDQRADDITDGLAKFSGRGLDSVQALVLELRASVARVDRAVTAIERDPSSIVFGGNSDVRDYNRR